MSEQDINEEEDVQGHRRTPPGATEDDDVQGHRRTPPGATEDDDDVQGHKRIGM